MTQPDHARLMDRMYGLQRHFYDLTRKYYLFGRDRMIRGLALRPGMRLIEVGCGTGRNLIRMARRFPGATFYGLDASQEMLKTASRAVTRAGLQDRIHLAQGYGEDLSPDTFGVSGFDAAVFSYSLSMIPDWQGAVQAAGACLCPGGMLHVVDFGDLCGLGRAGRWLLSGWLRLFHVTPRTDLVRNFEMCGAGRLQHLPGRYAFILVIARENIAFNATRCCKHVTEF